MRLPHEILEKAPLTKFLGKKIADGLGLKPATKKPQAKKMLPMKPMKLMKPMKPKKPATVVLPKF